MENCFLKKIQQAIYPVFQPRGHNFQHFFLSPLQTKNNWFRSTRVDCSIQIHIFSLPASGGRQHWSKHCNTAASFSSALKHFYWCLPHTFLLTHWDLSVHTTGKRQVDSHSVPSPCSIAKLNTKFLHILQRADNFQRSCHYCATTLWSHWDNTGLL